MNLVLGIDFGSASVRVIVLNIEKHKIVASASQPYSAGVDGVISSSANPHLARQSSLDYLESMTKAIGKVRHEIREKGYDLSDISGIGVDATGSTPIPVTREMIPLEQLLEFSDNNNALAWMWKDHTSVAEAEQITRLAGEIRPHYLDTIGGAYSSEWFWAKVLHCLNVAPEVFNAAYTWIELSDFIPAKLSGVADVSKVKRNKCAAGHKGLYNESWNGFPDTEFLDKLSPELVRIRESMPDKAQSIDDIAGFLCPQWAEKLGLPEGIPIAMGILDAHAGAIGSGVKKGVFVKIIGTSSCDLGIQPLTELSDTIKGVAGVAEESVLPGYYGIEAGQSAVGDIFNWYVSQVLGKTGDAHANLTEKAQSLNPGESGLLALDWNNGNRNVLTDVLLSGLIMGQSLQTTDYEIYRALIEATAFGARRIIEQMESQGVELDELICCGGIPRKNELFMQIYADVLGKPIKVSANEEAVALGAALMGAYASLKNSNNTTSYEALQEKFCKVNDKVFYPSKEAVDVYDRLYTLYLDLHDSFGVKNTNRSLFHVMKYLLKIKDDAQTNKRKAF